MKKRFLAFALLAAFFAVPPAGAQSVTQVFVTSVPAIGPMVDLTRIFADIHTLQWRVAGTASSCTVQIDGSPDGITWALGAVMASQSCTANGEFSQTNTVTNFARIDVTALSGNGVSVNFLYVASSSVSGAAFSLTSPHTWGPGVAGTGAAQTYTHPTGGANNQYNEILLVGDPALTFDRRLFGICSTVAGNSCIGQLYMGVDNDQNVVMSWNNTGLSIVGSQSESQPLRLYTPTAITSGNTFEIQPATLANSCVYFNACKSSQTGGYALFMIQDTGIPGDLACATNWNSTTFNIIQSCMPNTVYNAAGAIENNEATHSIRDSKALVAGTTTVTFSGSAAFTSATSYQCFPVDTTSAAPVLPNQTSGTSVTFTAPAGGATDNIAFYCTGHEEC